MKKIKFKIVKREKVLETPYMEVLRETVRPQDGQEFTHIFTKHPGSCVVVPLEENENVILVNQYRHPIRAYSLEVVAGRLESGDLVKEARRELEEEIGYTCENLELIGTFFASNSNTDEKAYIFLAQKLNKTKKNREQTEYMSETLLINLEKAIEKISKGEITDAHTIIALFLARKHLLSMGEVETT